MEPVGRLARALAGATSRSEVTGAHRLPRRGPALVMVNHTSIVDVAPVLAALTRGGLWPSPPSPACRRPGCGGAHGHVRFLVSELAMRHPVAGRLARIAGSIEVSGSRGGDALRHALAALERGEVVGIYPEGDVSATLDGAPRAFRPGVARLALAAGCPVVPVAHHDARRIGEGTVGESLGGALRAARAGRERPRLALVVGRPVGPAELTGLDVAGATRVLRAALVRTWEEAARRLRGVRAVGAEDGAGTDDLHAEDSTRDARGA